MAGRQKHKDERAKHLEAIGQAPLPLPSERRAKPIPYTDDLPDEALDLANCGLSETEIAAHWSIDMNTLQEWRETYPSFDAALSRARVASEAWWEEKARRAMEVRDNRFPAGAWAMVMKARFPAYRERVEVQHNIDIRQLVVIRREDPAGLPSQQRGSAPKPIEGHASVRLGPGQTACDDLEKDA